MISEPILLAKEQFYLWQAHRNVGTTRTVMTLGAMVCCAARTGGDHIDNKWIIVNGLGWPDPGKFQGWPDESRASEVMK